MFIEVVAQTVHLLHVCMDANHLSSVFSRFVCLGLFSLLLRGDALVCCSFPTPAASLRIHAYCLAPCFLSYTSSKGMAQLSSLPLISNAYSFAVLPPATLSCDLLDMFSEV
ncbi:hypothetical protein SADUNF_Sadunf02G0105500 [Salix dunnii]|uniref:Uncharacterized protein n=1 Tax=Salix dunnii TaxID=1413687 RepID=A0A835THG7_9ROSI|nr:hypothetical protein SADUNF_Sadunf02G0105500 [Salix dunnii]